MLFRSYALALPYYEESLAIKQRLGNQQEIANSKKMIELTLAEIKAQKTE